MFPTHVGRLAIFDDYLFLGDVGSGSFGKAGRRPWIHVVLSR